MDEEVRERLLQWLSGNLNPEGWPILKIEVRHIMLELYMEGKFDELGKLVQAAILEHQQHMSYLETLRISEKPSWVDSIPNHPVTKMRKALDRCSMPLLGDLAYFDDPTRHIFN